MTSVRDLDLPPGWGRSRRVRRLIAATGSLAAGLFLLVVGATGGLAPTIGGTVADVSFVLAGLGWVASGWGTARRTLRRSSAGGVELGRDDDGSTVLSIRQSRSAQVSALLGPLGLGAGLTLLGVANFAERGILALAGLAGVYLLGTSAVALRQGLTPAEIRLGPTLVRVRAGRRTFSTPWEEVDAVVATETRDGRQITLQGRDDPGIEIAADQFALDAVRLFHVLAYHYANPQARPELGTPAALQRVREGRFPMATTL